MLWIRNYFLSDPYPDPTFQEISDPDPTQLLSKEAKVIFLSKTEAQVLILKKIYVKPTCGFLFSLLYSIIDSNHWVLTEQISCYFSQ